MNVLPLREQKFLLLDDNLHGAADLAAVHALRPNQVRGPAGTPEIDLGLAIAKACTWAV
jgi:hypothetical protein